MDGDNIVLCSFILNLLLVSVLSFKCCSENKTDIQDPKPTIYGEKNEKGKG